MSFTHLHLHNEYSYLDGFGSGKAYAEYAKEKGFAAMALTNHGNIDGALDWQRACEENSIDPIQGIEFYIVKDHRVKEKEKRKHMTVLVKNQTGWTNLLKMITISQIEGFYYRPRISPEVLLQHCEGLVVMTACASSFIDEDWGLDLLIKLQNIIGDDLYLEIMPHQYAEQERINKLCLKYHESFNINLVATNDCHYIEKSDAEIQEVLLAMQSKKKWNDPTRWKFDITGLHLKTEEEMRKAFAKHKYISENLIEKAFRSTEEISRKCKEFRIKKLEVELPAVPKFKGRQDEEVLRELCEKGMADFGFSGNKIYEERYFEELALITKQGFSRYFLIVHELISWCRENDIMVGPGRGSSGGSLVAYLIGITQVDPIKYDLLFARFISPARIDLPDIDMDFEDIKRDRVKKHLEDTYGKNCVAGVSTVSRLKGRGAIRDVARVFSVPVSEVNKACSCIVVRSGGDFRSDYTIEDAFKTFEDGKRFYEKYKKVADIAMKIEGSARGIGQHAAAVIICSEDLREGLRANLRYGKEKALLVNWDKHDIEYFGIMKLDVLGINALTVLNDTRRKVLENYNKDIKFTEIDLDDKKVLSEFAKGNNTGCFQVCSLGLRKFCKQMKIDSFMMLVHASSLYRPGTLRSGMATEFIKRKNKEIEWKFPHPEIERITKNTLGVILYQEQVMQFMYDLGGLGWKTADTVRKVISKSQGAEQFQKFRQLFVDGCVAKKTLDERVAGKLWDELSSFGSYGFNLSHAVEYTMITYWDMYCKIYYPDEFLCSTLTYGSEIRKEEVIEEAIRLGVDIRPPKIGISKSHEWIVKDKIVYCPFIEIKGFGDKTAKGAEEFHSGKSNLTKRFQNVLLDLKCDRNEIVTEEEAERISGKFKFSFSKNRFYKLSKVLHKISSSVAFSKIKNVDFNRTNKTERLFAGEMTEIKFGYRSKLEQGTSNQEVAGGADNLGGVYGNFKDDEDFCMLVFDKKIYMEKKDLVEHSSEDFLLARCSNPNRTTSLLCHHAWFKDEILNGDLDGLDLKMKRETRFLNKNVDNCDKCQNCTRRITNSPGIYNMMIVGEYPSRSDAEKGKSMCNEYLWEELNSYGYKRRDFNISTVVKGVFDSKTLTKPNINKCSYHIEEEISAIKPFIIFAIGNASIKYFTEEDSGIMDKNGTTEWNDKANAWICWSINPSSIFYSEENKVLFKKAVKNFVNKIKILG